MDHCHGALLRAVKPSAGGHALAWEEPSGSAVSQDFGKPCHQEHPPGCSEDWKGCHVPLVPLGLITTKGCHQRGLWGGLGEEVVMAELCLSFLHSFQCSPYSLDHGPKNEQG